MAFMLICSMLNKPLTYYNNLNIANKLRFIGIFSIASTAFISIIIVLTYQYKNEKKSIENTTQTLTKIIAQNIAPALLFHDTKHLKESLQSLKYEKIVTNGYVMDLKWKVVESYNLVESNNTKIPKIIKDDSKLFWHNNKIFTVESIIIEEKNIGSIIIVASMDGLISKMIEEALFITFYIFLAMILAFQYHTILSGEILHPISKLNDSTNAIINTDELTARVEITNNDEIGELAQNFNIMIQELSLSRDTLSKQKDLLSYKAYHDELTGLPNRALFDDRLEQAIFHAKRHNTQVIILFLDIDHFKQINDTYGHDIGDSVINIFANRLRESTREEDTIARMGGDEFMIILENQIGRNNIVPQKILDSMKEPLNIVTKEIIITTSIGASIYPKDGVNAKELIKCADIAMYKIKRANRNNFKFYEQDL